ncbi:hypothetical protein RRG08_019206 [Elysia crispata]|uniref:Uncharacterized protein n=1 Tax=Elysia crispata TaxID=231223 RepID=A0AAE1E5I1_9GAST|nr:hypothetical protein RRG08_019206 [Elysia crispata]
MLANATSRLTCISSFDDESDGESPEPSPDDCDSPCGSLRSNGSTSKHTEDLSCSEYNLNRFVLVISSNSTSHEVLAAT